MQTLLATLAINTPGDGIDNKLSILLRKALVTFGSIENYQCSLGCHGDPWPKILHC